MARPTHYTAVDGSEQPFTVSHRVAFTIAGREHVTRVDTIDACRRAIQVNALLGLPSRLQYLGNMTVETADLLYPPY